MLKKMTRFIFMNKNMKCNIGRHFQHVLILVFGSITYAKWCCYQPSTMKHALVFTGVGPLSHQTPSPYLARSQTKFIWGHQKTHYATSHRRTCVDVMWSLCERRRCLTGDKRCESQGPDARWITELRKTYRAQVVLLLAQKFLFSLPGVSAENRSKKHELVITIVNGC